MILYEHPVSSYAQKIKIALREKGIAFKCKIPQNFGTDQIEPDFVQANPRLEVPVLIDEDIRLFDSTIIFEYLEDKWPEPSLLPRSPKNRAAARMIEDICDTHYEAVNWGYGELLWFNRATGALAVHLKKEVVRQTQVLQDWLSNRLGEADWFGGQHFGWADVAAAPMVNRSIHYGFSPLPNSRLAAWHARLIKRPSVVQTFAEFDAAVSNRGDGAALYASGKRQREYRDHRLEWMIKSGGLEIVQDGLRKANIRFTWP